MTAMRAIHVWLLSSFVAGLSSVHVSFAGEAVPPRATQSAAIVAATPAPPATPAPRPIVPAGTLYLLAETSVRTPSGIVGFEPGQAVRLVRTDAKTGRLLVTDGRYQVEVPSAQVTKDASVAAPLRQREEAVRQAAQAAQHASELAQQRREEALRRFTLNKDLEEAGAYRPPPPRLPTSADNTPWDSHLFNNPYDLRGDPYTPAHASVPRVQGPHSVPGSLAVKSNGLGYY